MFLGLGVNLLYIGKTLYFFICLVTLIASAFSCMRLIFILTDVVDYNYLLSSVLFPRINFKEISSNMKGAVEKGESDIDVSLKIFMSAINNDSIATERLFCSMSDWMSSYSL